MDFMVITHSRDIDSLASVQVFEDDEIGARLEYQARSLQGEQVEFIKVVDEE